MRPTGNCWFFVLGGLHEMLTISLKGEENTEKVLEQMEMRAGQIETDEQKHSSENVQEG